MPRVKLFDEQEVLEKAMNLFWKSGYHATSFEVLVKHLGISRSSVYDTYGNKETLFLKAIQHYRSTNQKLVNEFLYSHENVKEGISALFKRAIQQSTVDKDRKGCFVVNTATELLPNDGHIKKLVQQNQTDFEKVFLDYLQLGVEKGQITKGKDLKAIATLLFTLYNGLQVVTKVEVDQKRLLNSIEMALVLLE